MSERSERTSRSGGSGKNFSFAVSQKVYQKQKNCHFLNMHFNVSDPREGIYFIFLVNIPVNIHTQSTHRWYKG